VQLVTCPPGVFISQESEVVEVDHRYQKHGVDAILVQPDKSKCLIKVQTDTGACF